MEDEGAAWGTRFLYIFPYALIRQTIRKQPTLTKRHYYKDQTTAPDNNRTTHESPRYPHLYQQGQLRHDSFKSNSWAYQDFFSSQESHGVLLLHLANVCNACANLPSPSQSSNWGFIFCATRRKENIGIEMRSSLNIFKYCDFRLKKLLIPLLSILYFNTFCIWEIFSIENI